MISSDEFLERLVNNSTNYFLYEYALKNISIEKLINLFENREIDEDEVLILADRLEKEGDTEYVKENSYRLLKINSIILRNTIMKVSSLEKLEKGLREFPIRFKFKDVHLKTLAMRLNQECNTEYVKNEVVKLVLYVGSAMVYTTREEYKELIQTIVNVSSIETLMSTLYNDLYRENLMYVNFAIRRLMNEEHTEAIGELFSKLYKLDSIGIKKNVASIDIIVNKWSRSWYQDFEELINKE